MKIIALLAAYNEERFIRNCLENYNYQGIEVYLIDNESTDNTVKIAQEYLGKGLLNIETIEKTELHQIEPILNRKAELALELDADWFICADIDEIRIPGNSYTNLINAIIEVDKHGYNAINFLEFTFIPTLEEPDHDHDNYMETMKWYYPFLPKFPHRLTTWKKQKDPVKLTSHRVSFPELKMYPESFKMKHYLYLSLDHAIRKFGSRKYPKEALKKGWHVKRAKFNPAKISLVSNNLLREYTTDNELDPSNPRKTHFLFMQKCKI